jgi:hypothetical protein
MPSPYFRLALLMSLAAGASAPTAAPAQDPAPRRCIGPGGSTIYTDRPCETLGATARLPRGTAPAARGGGGRGGCARTLQELVYAITNAIDTRDANRLGEVYHWVGHDQTSGYRVLDRLQAIVDRPLVDIVPLRAASAQTETLGATPTAGAETLEARAAPISTPSAPVASAGESASADALDPTPRPVRARAPVGLRLEQTLANGSTPSRTVFSLRRHLDCWWISF